MIKKSINSITPSPEIVSSHNPFLLLLSSIHNRLRARHERHYKDSYFHFWADLLLGAILIGLVIIVIRLFVWQPQSLFSLEIISQSPKIVSGGVSEFAITYKNNEDQAITNAEIQVKFPKNFIVTSSNPAEQFNQTTYTFNLPSIPAHSINTLLLQGIVIGSVGDHQSLEVVATYQSNGFIKKVLASLPFVVSDSALDLTLQVPTAIYSDQLFSGTVQIKNTSTVKLENISIYFPEIEFTVTPQDKENNSIIFLPTLEGGEQRTISFNAKTENVGSVNFRVRAGLQVGELIFEQKEITQPLLSTKPSLLISTEVDSRVLDPSQPIIHATIIATNLEQKNLEDVSFLINSGRSDISVKQISSSLNTLTIRGTTIHLGLLSPGEKVTMPVTITLARKNISLEDLVYLNLTSSYRLDHTTSEYSMVIDSFKFNSNIYLDSGGYYYGPQGDQLGVGPIPPQVGIPTTYWVIWEINNIGNNVTDVTISGDIPSNIAWNERQSTTAGEVQYSAITRRVLWQPGEISRSGGNYRASFAVTLVPEVSDIGTVPALIESIKLTAKDTFTGAIIEKNLPIITTNLDKDPLSAHKGIVKETE